MHQELGNLTASGPRATDTKNRLTLLEFAKTSRELVHGDQRRIGEGAQTPFIRVAHVKDHSVVLRSPARPVRRGHIVMVAHDCNRKANPAVTGCSGPLPKLRERRRSRRAKIDIAVLASGSGTNLQALIDTADVRPHIRLVVSDRAEAQALTRAEAVGIDTAVVRWVDHEGRDEFSRAVGDVVDHSGAKGVVLAGFMRILSPSFIDRFPSRILNIHPSLLPSFPGVDAVEQALEHGAKITGVTVHLVDEEVDHGLIVAQRAVAINEDDTVESLHARIQVEEHAVYPEVVRSFIAGNLSMVSR